MIEDEKFVAIKNFSQLAKYHVYDTSQNREENKSAGRKFLLVGLDDSEKPSPKQLKSLWKQAERLQDRLSLIDTKACDPFEILANPMYFNEIKQKFKNMLADAQAPETKTNSGPCIKQQVTLLVKQLSGIFYPVVTAGGHMLAKLDDPNDTYVKVSALFKIQSKEVIEAALARPLISPAKRRVKKHEKNTVFHLAARFYSTKIMELLLSTCKTLGMQNKIPYFLNLTNRRKKTCLDGASNKAMENLIQQYQGQNGQMLEKNSIHKELNSVFFTQEKTTRDEKEALNLMDAFLSKYHTIISSRNLDNQQYQDIISAFNVGSYYSNLTSRQTLLAMVARLGYTSVLKKLLEVADSLFTKDIIANSLNHIVNRRSILNYCTIKFEDKSELIELLRAYGAKELTIKAKSNPGNMQRNNSKVSELWLTFYQKDNFLSEEKIEENLQAFLTEYKTLLEQKDTSSMEYKQLVAAFEINFFSNNASLLVTTATHGYARVFKKLLEIATALFTKEQIAKALNVPIEKSASLLEYCQSYWPKKLELLTLLSLYDTRLPETEEPSHQQTTISPSLRQTELPCSPRLALCTLALSESKNAGKRKSSLLDLNPQEKSTTHRKLSIPETSTAATPQDALYSKDNHAAFFSPQPKKPTSVNTLKLTDTTRKRKNQASEFTPQPPTL